MIWILIGLGALVVLWVGQMIHLNVVMTWEDQQTVGLGYYGLPPTERGAFKDRLRRHARLLSPILHLIGKTSKFTFAKASFEQDGLFGPRGTCDEESFARGFAYQTRPEDVFVVTQMKCGTTWMQHLVYEVLRRGSGDLVESGTALYAVSPWLEARKSVEVGEAPLIGQERPSRVIKTHLPVSHCPFDREARYIYVARQPVSCLASCADFIAANAGPLRPTIEDVEHWFTSEDMWWGPWPTHVAGWWEASQREDNVLFLRFEDMKKDLAGVIRSVADFLGITTLQDDEIERVMHKCGFEYMRENNDAFEMHPPHILAVDGQMFVRGTADRHLDVAEDIGDRVLDWCREELAGSDLSLERLYPA